jgi:hypothetical protein
MDQRLHTSLVRSYPDPWKTNGAIHFSVQRTYQWQAQLSEGSGCADRDAIEAGAPAGSGRDVLLSMAEESAVAGSCTDTGRPTIVACASGHVVS